jgi:DNA repair exonuclease SbcCD ATPase subunit
MKRRKKGKSNMPRMTTAPLALVGLLFAAIPAMAGLSEDYQELVQTRQTLEQERQSHESRLETMGNQIRSLNMVFFQCVSLKEKDFWEARINEANAAKDALEVERKTLAELRKKIDAARRDLETRRREIEAAHTRKGPGTPYETEFREYMAALESDYFIPLQNQLFDGYEGYKKTLQAYIDLLKDSVGRCMNRSSN